MDFLIEKKDCFTERVVRDFPYVNLIEITDPDVLFKILNSQYLFVDSRIDLWDYNDVFLVLEAETDYITLTIEAEGYSMKYRF